MRARRSGRRGRTRGAATVLALAVGCAPAGHDAAGSHPTAATIVPPSAGCPGTAPAELVDCVDRRRLAQDVAFAARARPPGSVHWRRVQAHCAQTFADLGLSVEMHDYGTGVNVVGTLVGAEAPDQRVVVGAHYDHIPGCAGADDNATGVAAVLEIGRVVAAARFDRTLVLACWDEEERGMVGSRAYARRAAARGENIVVDFTFDGIGVASSQPHRQRIPDGFGLLFADEVARLQAREFRADFVAVIADREAEVWARTFVDQATAHELPAALLSVPPLLRHTPLAVDLHRSDHASFWAAGYPAMLITDTAEFRSPRYHCREGPDDLSTIDADFLDAVVSSATGTVVAALAATEQPSVVVPP